jgi:hypothetical protein
MLSTPIVPRIPFLLTLVVLSGCVIRGDGRVLAYGIDGALVVTGVLVVRDANETQCQPGWGQDLCETTKGLGAATGAAMVAGGVIGAVITALLHEKDIAGPQEDKPPPAEMKPECLEHFQAIHAGTTQQERRAAVRAAPAYCYGGAG